METSGKTAEDCSPELSPSGARLYRRAVGKLLFAVPARPDLAFTVKTLARSVARPTEFDYQRLKRCLRYVQGTKDWVLHLVDSLRGESSDEVSAVADADWASGVSRKSTSGGALFFAGVLVHSWSRTQASVSLSTCEAELAAMSMAAQEGRYLVNILAELGEHSTLRVYSDSSSARAVTMRRGVGRLKHLDTREIWIQDELRAHRLEVRGVSSLENLADLFTKPFARARHVALSEAIGMGVEE